MNKLLLCSSILFLLYACSGNGDDGDDYSDYCPRAVKHIPLTYHVSFKCFAGKNCNETDALLEFGRVSRRLDVGCFGGVYEYDFVSGDVHEEITNDLAYPKFELKPDSETHIQFSLIDIYKDEKRYDLNLWDYVPKFQVVGDSLEIQIPTEGYVSVHYLSGVRYCTYLENGEFVRLDVVDSLLPFFVFFDSVRTQYDDLIKFDGIIYWK